ncbi:MAG: glutamine synthetase [Bradyrhizobium sp.]|nr:glutamine synthetase [Bradyrhizobium sp.]
MSFVDRHDLWSDDQRRAASVVEREIKRRKLEVIRFAFCDQHGVLRGKTLVAAEAAKAMRAGVTMTSTLLAKDTSHRTVFDVFSAGGGMGLDEMAGAGNFVMVADPSTFRVLPWTNNTGWMLCDIYFPNGKPVPFSTRGLGRDALRKLGQSGFDFFAGLEVEFQLFKLVDPKLSSDGLTWPAEAPAVEHTTHGFQYLTESRFDQVDPILEVLRKTMQALGMPLLSLEVELGPSQYEFTFAPEQGLSSADTMVLFRSDYLAGLLAHARAAAAFTTPTINGYKRYHGINSMAPIQAVWAKDNRGVMVRVLGEPGDPSTHLENRVGEPLANPYLYWSGGQRRVRDGLGTPGIFRSGVTTEMCPPRGRKAVPF